MPRSFPHPYLFLRWLSKQVSIPSGRCSWGFRVAILSQQLSPWGSGVRCPRPPCNGSGKHVPCYSGSWWSPGRHMSQESDFSICPSLKQKSAAQQSQFGSKHLPRIHACLGRSPHSSIRSFLKPFPPAYMAATSLQTARHLLPYYPRPHGRKTPFSTPFQTVWLLPPSLSPPLF